MSELSEAVKILVKALNKDPDYRRSWKANIAMGFKDAYSEEKTIHEIANEGADRFLNILTGDLDE